MPTIEERLQALEQEHAELKKTIELQTIAIGALVNKATLEKLNEKCDRIFEALMTHDRLTNEQLAELRNQQTELDGKIVGLQTETHQRFNEQDSKIAGLQTETRQHFNEQDSKVAGLQTEMRQHFNEQDSKVAGLQTEMRQTAKQTETHFDRIEALLAQILERLP